MRNVSQAAQDAAAKVRVALAGKVVPCQCQMRTEVPQPDGTTIVGICSVCLMGHSPLGCLRCSGTGNEPDPQYAALMDVVEIALRRPLGEVVRATRIWTSLPYGALYGALQGASGVGPLDPFRDRMLMPRYYDDCDLAAGQAMMEVLGATP